MDMMTSFGATRYPLFSAIWIKTVLTEIFRIAGAAAIWTVTLPFAAVAVLCVTAWDTMRSGQPSM